MSRQRFNGLRMELVRRINTKYGGQPIGKAFAACRDLSPAFDSVKSYKGAWEALKPARDLVGM